VSATVHRISDREPEAETYPIVRHIPVPERKHGSAEKTLATLKKMRVGDSFICTSDSKVYGYAKRLGIEITARRIGEYYRVWRTA